RTALSWPRYPSERLGEGVRDLVITEPEQSGSFFKLSSLPIQRCAEAAAKLDFAPSNAGARAMKHYLDFEKPIVELQRKLEELRKHPETHSLGISFEEEAAQIEKKIEETRRMIFSNLTPWQRVQLARHPKRPYTLDYLQTTFTDFSELHGDRLYSDDRAIVGGLARLGDHKVVVIGTQKGHDTKENI